MAYTLNSLGLRGIEGYAVAVECYLASGLPSFEIVGLPDAAVREARERVRAAIKSCGYRFPVSRITVNLAPADQKKSGTPYDLPIALGILAASGIIPPPPEGAAFFGELSLGGELRPVRGALPMALAAQRAGLRELYVPAANAREAAFARGLQVYPVARLDELCAHLEGTLRLTPEPEPHFAPDYGGVGDFSEVKGQENVKRALEIAVAGGHNVLLCGPPGSGKSMLASRLPSIFPSMELDEALEVTQIHSVAGRTSSEHPVITERPFRSPHHTVSAAALVGGGSTPVPGEVSLAHGGVLFLDELPEFARATLDTLRQPLESGEAVISRVAGTVTFPSRFMLVCAMNPCRCGWYGHPSGRCTCTKSDVQRYRARVSGPILDRIDIFVEVQALAFHELRREPDAEPSAAVRARVERARAIQRERLRGEPDMDCNARMGGKALARATQLDETCEQMLRAAFTRLNLTARSYDKILRVARTVADLAGAERIAPAHLAEALQFRSFDPRMGNE